MRIRCVFCGERDLSEFVYLGDAGYRRPAADSDGALQAYTEAVYLRDNPSSFHRELWYHAFGCRSWLRVTRDTRTHEIQEVEFANDGAGTEAAESDGSEFEGDAAKASE